MTFQSSTHIATILIAAAMYLGFSSRSALAQQRPNIVFILADDMSRDTWGAYGSKDCKTPNIDKIAKEGIRFDRAYCTVAMCAPFRQELYSGRTPWRTGTLANHSRSVADTKSIPHYLKPLGYRTALIGKTHVAPANCYPFEYLKAGDKSKDQNDLYVEKATGFIDSCAQEKKPFCVFIASNDSHAPFTTGDQSAYDADKLTVPPYWVDTPELREEMVKYYAEITNFDALVGRVRKVLEQKGLWQNTIFMVCSEQGTQLPFAKWTCYNNGLHTGLVAHWPNVAKPGTTVDALISTADVTPTLVEAAGGSLKPTDCDGESFLDVVKGNQKDHRNYVYGAFTNCNIIGNNTRIYPIRVIRDKTYSLIYNPNHTSQTSNLTLSAALAIKSGANPKKMDSAASWTTIKSDKAQQLVQKLHDRPEYELYNRAVDPHELKNEINNPEYKAVAEKLKKALSSRLQELNDADPIATEKKLVKTKAKKGKKPNKKK